MLPWERMMEAEVCELIGIYMLYLIGKKYDLKKYWAIWRWRTSRIQKCKWTSFRKNFKKQLQSLFKQKSLQIIIECNLKVVNYLDVTFNLNDGSYRPYRKPNDETHYIHIQSDHPPSITKQLPRSIKKRLSQLSSSKDIFYETTPYYEQRLARCGYNEKLSINSKEKILKIIKTLGKIKNAILYGLTHPTANLWRQTLANTSLDSSTNIFHQVTNFTKSLIKTL